jgi:Leucine-rich repeat (LRR) protein
LEAVKESYFALNYIDSIFKNDKDVIFALINTTYSFGSAIKYFNKDYGEYLIKAFNFETDKCKYYNSKEAEIYDDFFCIEKKKFKEIEKLLMAPELVKELNLEGFNLTECPQIIETLTNLKILNLSDNLITKLPIEIGKLNQLEVLNLSGNTIINLQEISQLLPHTKIIGGL